MPVKYEYSLMNDFPNQIVNITTLTQEIANSNIECGLSYINILELTCELYFKCVLTSEEESLLDAVVAAHTGVITTETDAPRMADGRPIVRADTRPLGTQTYFTMCGDDIEGEVLGNGKVMKWDFSNDDDLYNPDDFENPRPTVSGMKYKLIDIEFLHNVYMKDGCVYFFDAPWGAWCDMYIVVPSGTYYPNPNGSIPAAALGLSGDQMYAYSTKRVFYATYVQKHQLYTSCPMGDELNAEGATTDPIPPGWTLTAIIANPAGDTNHKGYGEFEVYRTTIGLL
jgi:hypothetical protein